MEIGEKRVILAKKRVFRGQRLLDLDDHIRALEDLGVLLDDFRAGIAVILVAKTDVRARLGFHHDLVAVFDELIGR